MPERTTAGCRRILSHPSPTRRVSTSVCCGIAEDGQLTCALEGPPAGERPTRIAFLTHEFTMGGIERVHLNLAAAFLRKGLEVDIVMLKKRGEFLSQIPAAVRVVELPSAGSWRRLRDNISDYLLHRRPTVLVASTEHLCVFALWARAGINSDSRIVVNVQTQSAPEQARRERWKHRWFIPLFMRRYYRQAHAIIAVSEGVAEETARIAWLPRERVQVIYNPSVTDELFDRARQPPAHPWLTDDGPPVVLAAGRLVDQKDFPTLLRAFAVLRRRRDARLLILGEGPRRAALEALVRQLGIADEVAMPGFVDNPYACMARARLFVLSSAWEGLPLVLGEALACGCPVVSTDCPSGPREVLDRGSYGRLVPVGDGDALAGAMLEALDAPHHPESLRFRARDFHVDGIAEAYLDAFGLADRAAKPDGSGGATDGC